MTCTVEQVMHDIWRRARRAISLEEFATIQEPERIGRRNLECPYDRQYILRMMVMSPEHGVCIPSEIEWLADLFNEAGQHQRNHGIAHPFAYITVRHGEVTSVTDDEWHTDGFSCRVTHLPEQNYIWSTAPATQFLRQRFDIPSDFNPLRHDLHKYIQDRADVRKAWDAEPKCVYVIDPYVIHRRPPETFGTHRTFVRVSFVPIEIRDNKQTSNPMMSTKTYAPDTFRDRLERY